MSLGLLFLAIKGVEYYQHAREHAVPGLDFRLDGPEARAVEKVLRGRLPNPFDLYHIRQGWTRAGVEVAWRDVPALMFEMRQVFLDGMQRHASAGRTAGLPA